MIKISPLLTALLLTVQAVAQRQFYNLLDSGYTALESGKHSEARKHFESAQILIPKNYAAVEKAALYNDLGVVYYQLGEYKKGIDSYLISLDIYQQTGRDSLIAESLLNLGLAYKGIGLFDKATEELTSAARILERNKQEKELASAWNAIGNIQREIGDFQKALAYHQKALALRRKLNYVKGIADSYHNIGSVYLDQKQLDSAGFFLNRSLELKNQLPKESNKITTLTLLGELYTETNRLDLAYKFLNEAYSLRQDEHSSKIASSLLYLGNYYVKMNNPGQAIKVLQQSEQLCRESGNNKVLAEVLEAEIKLMKNAPAQQIIAKYKELLSVKESLVTEESGKEIARLEIKYDTERKDKEIQVRRKQARINSIKFENQRLKNQQLVTGLAGTFVIVIILVVVWYKLRKKKNQIQSQNIDLERQKQEIYHLHHELSHRTKNYFSMLSGILKMDKKKAEHAETANVLEENIQRMQAMSIVHRHLLDDSTQQNRNVRLDLYLQEILDNIVLNLSSEHIRLSKDLEAVYMDYDISMRIAIVLNELVCNAIKHALLDVNDPALEISLKTEGKTLFLIVKDNGKGFINPDLRNISKGVGIISKMLQVINGSIAYKNDGGCAATISLNTKSGWRSTRTDFV